MSNISRLQDDLDEQSIALDIARNQVGMRLPISELLTRIGISEQKFKELSQSQLFKNQVNGFVKELEENGVSFQLKARIQAEEMLKTQWRLVHDPDTPPTVTVKAIENTVRWAGLEPKNNTQIDAVQGPGFSITINFPTDAQKAEAKIIAEERAVIDSTEFEEVNEGAGAQQGDAKERGEEVTARQTFTLENPGFDAILHDDDDDEYYDAEDEL